MSKATKITKLHKDDKALQESKPITPPSPISEMDRLFDRWFNTFFPSGLMRPFGMESPLWRNLPGARAPKVDVIDRDEEVLVRAEIPGVEKDDLDVSISDTFITIKGHCKHEEKEEKGEYYRSEISRGAFSRTVSLPEYVDTDKAKASFKDGILEMTLPKKEKAKRRSIKIE